MECHDVLEATLARLSGEPSASEAPVEAHLAGCASCRAAVHALEETWARLSDDPDTVPSAGWRRETLERLDALTLERRVRPFRPRRVPAAMGQIAAMLLAGVAGFFLARGTGLRGGTGGVPANAARLVPVVSQATMDVSTSVPDLSQRPRLANVAYRPAGTDGRIGVSFEVTTRYDVVGRPGQKGIADLLAYLVAGAGETEGARGQAIDLVLRHYREAAPPSPEIVRVLAATLKGDRNPGVRKKAAEALAQLPASPEVRDAFVKALKEDANPAIRILAVEVLARAATGLDDEKTIETLREKASDERENGYIRGQAALALDRIRR